MERSNETASYLFEELFTDNFETLLHHELAQMPQPALKMIYQKSEVTGDVLIIPEKAEQYADDPDPNRRIIIPDIDEPKIIHQLPTGPIVKPTEENPGFTESEETR